MAGRPLTNSEIVCFQTCERKWQLAYEERRTGFGATDALDRGTRMHAWLAAFHTGVPWMTPLELGELSVLGGYANYYPRFRDAKTNVPFVVRMGFVDVAGEVDALTSDTVIEHKTTTADVSAGSAWWNEKLLVDTQATTYQIAFPSHRVLFDAIRMPTLRQKKDETGDGYAYRVLEDIAEQPAKYFQRAFATRLEADIERHIEDVNLVAERMQAKSHPRNAKACFSYGRPCEFLDACWLGRRIEDYPQQELNHSEQVVQKLEMAT